MMPLLYQRLTYRELNAVSSYLQSFSNNLRVEKFQAIERLITNLKMLNEMVKTHDDKLKVLDSLYQFIIRLHHLEE